LKSVLRYIPVLGWCCSQHDCIFLERDLKLDQEIIRGQLRNFAKHKSENWLILYAEGTYCTPHSHWLIEKNHEFSRKNGLPVLYNVLLPRTTGFELIMETREAFDYVTDVTIAYSKPYQVKVGAYQPPNMLQMFIPNDNEPVTVHLHYRTYKMSDLPTEKAELSKWLINLYKEKEQLLEQFEKVGSFPNNWLYQDDWMGLSINMVLTLAAQIIIGYFMYQWIPKIFISALTFNVLSALLVVGYDLHSQNSGFRPSKIQANK